MTDKISNVLGNPARLASLRSLALLDAPEDETLTRLSRMASTLLGTPVAMVTLVDEQRQFFASSIGLPPELAAVRQTPIASSICQYAVLDQEPLVVADTRSDTRLRSNPAVLHLGVAAYAGVPLYDGEGQALGTLCVIDQVPRQWTEAEIATLHDLADLTQEHFAHRILVKTAWEQGEAQHALLNAVTEGVWVTDAEGRCTFANAAGAALLGRQPEELPGQLLHDLVRPYGFLGQQMSATDWPLLTPLQTGEPVMCTGEIIHLPGQTPRVIEYSAAPIAAGDTIGGLVATVSDVTAQVESAAAVRQGVRRFQAIFTEGGIGIAVLTLDSRFVDTNRALQEFLGYSHAELLQLSMMDVTYPEDLELNMLLQEELVAGRRTNYRMEKRYLRHDGQLRWGDVTVSLMRDDQGQPEFLVGMVEDITSRKEAEAALLHAAESFNSTFNASGEGLLICHAEVILAANATAATMLRSSIEQIAGQRLGAVSSVLGEWFTTRQQAASDDAPAELLLAQGVDQPLPVEVSGKAIQFQGQPAWLVAVRDIRERHAALAQLAASEFSLAEAQRIAHIGSWQYNYATGELRLSDEAYRIAGRPPRSYPPNVRALLAAIHPEDRVHAMATFQPREAVMPLPDIDYRIVRPNGEIRLVHQRSEILSDAQGRPTQLVGVAIDVTEQRTLESRLAYQATHDNLTGLPNRPYLLDRLTESMERVRQAGALEAVLFLDLDDFKDINDSRGHDKGDRLLEAVAIRLQSIVPEQALLARMGGDEFVILLTNASDEGAIYTLADRLLNGLAAPLLLDGDELNLSGSIGIVILTNDYARPEEILRDADVAMYQAKEEGRARYAVFNPTMQQHLRDRLEMERDLAFAAERGELRILYQPKVNLLTGRMELVEALLRWQHPVRGLISPGEFIPLAERTGLIVPIGGWVLATACQQFKEWETAYPIARTVRLAVNLSPRQFRDPQLLETITVSLAETRFEPARLVLEVTESAAMERIEETVATLHKLRGLGLRLALDDFGTGYSSLSYLRQLPLNTLKIDRSFFTALDSNRAIIHAVTDLAHGLGLDVVAEGLETVDQVALARAAGCNHGQGFYFARPISAEAVVERFKTTLIYDLPQSQQIVDLVTRLRSGGIS